MSTAINIEEKAMYDPDNEQVTKVKTDSELADADDDEVVTPEEMSSYMAKKAESLPILPVVREHDIPEGKLAFMTNTDTNTIKKERDEIFGPREGFVREWRRALVSPTLLLDVTVLSLMAAIPGFMLPQHTRPVPAQSVNGTWAREWMFARPHVPETVSSLSLFLIGGLVPVLSALLLSFVSPARGAVKAWVHSYLWTMGTQTLIVGGIKAYCGYWRPYFLNECNFSDATGVCAAEYEDYESAFRSFPSGHASGSVAALLHTSLRLLGALRVGSTPRAVALGQTGYSLELDGLLTMLCLGPTLVAAWVAASRVHDNAHHPADVVGGAFVGGGAAVLWYLRYFHAPFGPDSHRARLS